MEKRYEQTKADYDKERNERESYKEKYQKKKEKFKELIEVIKQQEN
jgi:hypothetical protein